MLDYRVQLDVVSEGYGEFEWFQPRAGIIPPSTAVLTMSKALVAGSDVFFAVHDMRSDDLGKTWGQPVAHQTLDRRPLGDGAEVACCDMTPAWRAQTGRLLATGHTANYHPDEKGPASDNRYPRDVAYSVYDSDHCEWSQWQTMTMPDRDYFFWASAGCAQHVDLPNGNLLLPLYCMDRESVGSNFWKSCFFATVARCSFDGTNLVYLEHGNEMTVADPRGFCEPSLTRFADRYYLTLRNDVRGYVTTSSDGLHFEQPIAWGFDDGQELGSYNTQQHWVTHSDGLFLVYTRRGANNDHVFRHRAPLFMAQVDPVGLCVMRNTERALVPNRGAQLGNFGTVNVSSEESWLLTSECMQGLTGPHDANNRVYICRLLWNRANKMCSQQSDKTGRYR